MTYLNSNYLFDNCQWLLITHDVRSYYQINTPVDDLIKDIHFGYRLDGKDVIENLNIDFVEDKSKTIVGDRWYRCNIERPKSLVNMKDCVIKIILNTQIF